MELIISNSNPSPIYEQIATQIKAAIMDGSLGPGEQLPSIRGLANSLRVSVITTKRAYADLEEQGFIQTVQGRGCFVTSGSTELLREEQLRSIETQLSAALEGARSAGVKLEELHEMLDVLAASEDPSL
ncbi:MAG: GntR family transcriptional regulator [Coriobacteriales bacterium]